MPELNVRIEIKRTTGPAPGWSALWRWLLDDLPEIDNENAPDEQVVEGSSSRRNPNPANKEVEGE